MNRIVRYQNSIKYINSCFPLKCNGVSATANTLVQRNGPTYLIQLVQSDVGVHPSGPGVEVGFVALFISEMGWRLRWRSGGHPRTKIPALVGRSDPTLHTNTHSRVPLALLSDCRSAHGALNPWFGLGLTLSPGPNVSRAWYNI